MRYMNVYLIFFLRNNVYYTMAVKGNTLQQAKERFTKKYPKFRIVDAHKASKGDPIISAI